MMDAKATHYKGLRVFKSRSRETETQMRCKIIGILTGALWKMITQHFFRAAVYVSFSIYTEEYHLML